MSFMWNTIGAAAASPVPQDEGTAAPAVSAADGGAADVSFAQKLGAHGQAGTASGAAGGTAGQPASKPAGASASTQGRNPHPARAQAQAGGGTGTAYTSDDSAVAAAAQAGDDAVAVTDEEALSDAAGAGAGIPSWSALTQLPEGAAWTVRQKGSQAADPSRNQDASATTAVVPQTPLPAQTVVPSPALSSLLFQGLVTRLPGAIQPPGAKGAATCGAPVGGTGSINAATGNAGTGALDTADAVIGQLEQAARGAVNSTGGTPVDGAASAGSVQLAAQSVPAASYSGTGPGLASAATAVGVAAGLVTSGAVTQQDSQGGVAQPDPLALAGAALPGIDPGTQTTGNAPQAATASVSARNHFELAQALGERLNVQVGQGVQNATIRLDPPSKGTIEIQVRTDNGSVQVHLRASDPDVQRQLQNMGDALREDLVQRNHRDVSVQVWDGASDQGRGRRQGQTDDDERAPGRAWEQQPEEAA